VRYLGTLKVVKRR